MTDTELLERAGALVAQGRGLTQEAPKRARPFLEKGLELMDLAAHSLEGQSKTDAAQVIADLHSDIGLTYYFEGNLDAALDHFRTGVSMLEKLIPNSVKLGGRTLDLARVYKERGQIDLALNCYERAVSILASGDPGSLETAGAFETAGVAYYQAGKPEQAREHLERAAAIYEANRPRSLEQARVLNSLGVAARAAGDRAAALSHLRKAREILEATAPRSVELAGVLHILGIEYVDGAEPDLEQALDAFNRAIAIFSAQDGSSPDVADCLEYVATIHVARDDFAGAIDPLERALAIWEASDARSQRVATCLHHLGLLYRKRTDLGRALELLERALSIWQSFDPRSHVVARCLSDIAYVLTEQGEPSQALQRFEQALAVWEEIDPRAFEVADCLNSVGLAHHELGEHERALERIGRALRIAEAIDPRSEQTAVCLGSMGLVYADQGDVQSSLAHYERALELWKEIDADPNLTADCLARMGRAYYILGDLGGALTHYERALDLFESIEGHASRVADCLNDIGMVYLDRGDGPRALDCFERALELSDRIARGSKLSASCHNSIAAVYNEQGDYGRRIEHLERALAIAEADDDSSRHTAEALGSLAIAYSDSGDQARAMEYAERAVEVSERVSPGSKTTAMSLNTIGMIHLEAGDPARSRPYLERAFEIWNSVAPQSRGAAQLLANLASAKHRAGDLDDAIQDLGRSVEIVESLRARAGSSRAKEEVFARYQPMYQQLIAWLHERGGPGAAERSYEYAERSRARVLVDLLSERKLDFSPTTPEQADLLAQELAIQQRLTATHDRLAKARQRPESDPELLVGLAREERALEDRLERLRGELRAAFPAYAELEYPEPLTVAQVQSALETSTLLLEYDATGKEAFVWAVRSGGFSMQRLETTSQELDELVEASVGAYRTEERAGADSSTAAQARAELARILLGPVPEEFWVGIERLLVVPDGLLHYLPFETLPFPIGAESMLTDLYPIAYAPSFTALESVRTLWQSKGAAPGAEFLGFGDPAFADEDEADDEGEAERRLALRGTRLRRLPYAAKEVERISKTLAPGATTYVGREATEHRVKSESSGYRYLHFATHGLLDDDNPLYSGLALAPPLPEEQDGGNGLDDMLQVHEMFAMHLDAELVVCSACSTGLGKLHAGEGLVSMSRALFFAGARCVVVSLWPVSDPATARVMDDFYRGLKEGHSIVEALRLAKAAERAQNEDPFYWAAFVPLGLAW